jgi:hypothetical protein
MTVVPRHADRTALSPAINVKVAEDAANASRHRSASFLPAAPLRAP